MTDAQENPPRQLRKAVFVAILVLIALGLPGYVASYATIEAASEFSRILFVFGMLMFSLLWILTLLFTVRAVVKIYSLRLEHPGWDSAFRLISKGLEALENAAGIGDTPLSSDVKTLLRPYFLLPISKAGLLRLSITSYFLTIYGYALLYKLIAMNYPDAFSPKSLDLVSAIYFSVITIATVGYGDVVPVMSATKLLVVTEVMAGVAYTVFFFSVLANLIRVQDR